MSPIRSAVTYRSGKTLGMFRSLGRVFAEREMGSRVHEPMNRSTHAFCHGERCVVRTFGELRTATVVGRDLGPRKKAFKFRRQLSKISRGMRLYLAPVIRAELFEGRMSHVSSA